MPANVHHLGQFLHGLVDVPLHFRQGRNNQIADGMAGQELVGTVKAVLKNIPFQLWQVRQGHQGIANVTWWHHVDVVAQDPGRPPVVGDRYHRRNFNILVAQAAQNDWQPGPATDHHHFGSMSHEYQFLLKIYLALATSR